MGSASKIFALFLTIIFGMSCLTLLVVKPASAQTATPSSVPTPSVPEFTVQPVGPPLIVNTTYSLDPNTGKIVAHIGYTNEYSAVNITIKNQPYSPIDSNTFYFNVRVSSHDSGKWTELWNAYLGFPTQSNTEFTVISIIVSTNPAGSQTNYGAAYATIPVGAETDIQVEAMIGTIGRVPPSYYWVFGGQTSGWSSTQTVSIPADVPLSPTPAPSSSSPLTPTETPTSTAASSSLISFLLITSTVVIAILLAVIIALLLYIRKQNRLASAAKKDESAILS